MRLWLAFFCFFVFFDNLQAHPEEIGKTSPHRVSVGKDLSLYTGADPASFSEVVMSKEFRDLEVDVPNLGISSSDKWLRLPITNNIRDGNLLLEIAYPLLDEVELFSPSQEGDYRSVKLGEHQVFSDRTYQVPTYVFDINIPIHTTKILFLRVRSTEQIILPVYVSDSPSLFLKANIDTLISGIYIGIVFIMAVYNLFLFFSVRERGYLYYVLYVAFAGVTQMGIKGYSFQYLWPYFPDFSTIGPIILGSLSGLCALLFADSFLQIRKNAAQLRWVFGMFILFFIVSFLMTIFQWKQVGLLSMQLTTGIASLFVLYVSYRVMINGYRPARYFVFGWTILLLGSVVFLLKDYGVLDYNDFTSNAVQIASVIEMALLSFGLAYSINMLKKEKEVSQARELAISLENERLIREQNIMLEQNVEQRTRELTESNESLQTTLSHLKETQSQLVEAEKMASLGQLTAGVA